MYTIMTTLFSSSLVLATCVRAEDAVPAERKPRAVRDGELIVDWLYGGDGNGAFERRGCCDVGYLKRADEVIFFSDIEGLATPKWAKRATYERLKARSSALKNGYDRAQADAGVGRHEDRRAVRPGSPRISRM